MDARRHSAACERNRGPILEALATLLPARGRVLEIASGTGQHVAHFAAALPQLDWQPSDRDDEGFASIAAWCEGLPNVRAPIVLDVTRVPWPAGRVDAVFNANMIHIAPWAACEGLFAGASRALVPGGPLVLYGPFRVGGRDTAPSNAAFDADLRARDPAWGVRDLEAVVAVARKHGLELVDHREMPANNRLVAFAAPVSAPEAAPASGGAPR